MRCKGKDYNCHPDAVCEKEVLTIIKNTNIIVPLLSDLELQR